jgi:hypothetical protein
MWCETAGRLSPHGLAFTSSAVPLDLVVARALMLLGLAVAVLGAMRVRLFNGQQPGTDGVMQ